MRTTPLSSHLDEFPGANAALVGLLSGVAALVLLHVVLAGKPAAARPTSELLLFSLRLLPLLHLLLLLLFLLLFLFIAGVLEQEMGLL